MMRISKRKNIQSPIDLSPMLDVIFQLILFFLVSTTFASLPGITLNLPKSSTAQGTDASGATISIQKDGTMYFNDKISSFKLLDEQLQSIELGKFTKDNYPFMVTADEDVTNGTIVKVFDALRKNGYCSISLRTSEQK